MHALLAQDIMPLGTFKATATAVLRDLNLRSQPLVLTQNGRPAAVLLSPAEYDALTANQRFLAAVAAGAADADAGRTLPLAEVAAQFGVVLP